MKYHSLFLSKTKKAVSKFVACCSRDWRFMIKVPIMTAADNKFFDIFPNFRKIRYNISFASRRLSRNTMTYLLFLKKQQNLKLLSAANYRWHFMV